MLQGANFLEGRPWRDRDVKVDSQRQSTMIHLIVWSNEDLLNILHCWKMQMHESYFRSNNSESLMSEKQAQVSALNKTQPQIFLMPRKLLNHWPRLSEEIYSPGWVSVCFSPPDPLCPGREDACMGSFSRLPCSLVSWWFQTRGEGDIIQRGRSEDKVFSPQAPFLSSHC